jgi:biotin carboxyl carrier protein
VIDAASLDRVVSTTTTASWLALTAVLVALVAATVWAFVATVPQQVTDVGVVDARAQSQQVVSPADGVVRFLETGGTTVAAGTKLATVTSADGSATAVMAPIAGTVSGIGVLDGSSVIRGSSLMVVSAEPEAGIDTAVTLVSAARASLYSGTPSVQVAFADLATGRSYQVPAQVTSISNTPTTLGEQPSAALRNLFQDSADDAPGQVLYQVDLRLLNLQEVPAGSRTVGGQVLTITNTYARPHPIELLFSDAP